ncbi:MAG: PHP domain-containing protein [Candidatus Diapherotrites archaeon]
MRLDMHVHSKYSHDALTKPETLVARAKKLGIGFALTDHNTGKGWELCERLAQEQGVPFIRGEEINVYHEGRFCGELMGLFMNAPVRKREYADVIDELHAQGALVSVPHPFDTFRAPFEFLGQCSARIDLVEVLNSRVQNQEFNSAALEFARAHKMPGIAGSDAHTPEELGNAYVALEASSLEEARRLLVRGKCTCHGKPSGFFVHVQTWLRKRGMMGER